MASLFIFCGSQYFVFTICEDKQYHHRVSSPSVVLSVQSQFIRESLGTVECWLKLQKGLLCPVTATTTIQLLYNLQ